MREESEEMIQRERRGQAKCLKMLIKKGENINELVREEKRAGDSVFKNRP